MILGRKFKIWLLTFSSVLAVFLLYLLFGDTSQVSIPKADIKLDISDVNISSDANSGRIGDARLGYLEQARFETVNPETRRLERVIGFQRVLHKSGNQWELDKPFMSIFQKDFRCDLTADTGTVELENIEGTQPSPKSAVLTGNVVIHIIPNENSPEDDSFIYLDEVEFDGDRSMFFSNSKIVVDSKFARLEGKGMEILYNGLDKKLEYLEIKQVDFLNIFEIPQKEQPDGADATAVMAAETLNPDSNEQAVADAQGASDTTPESQAVSQPDSQAVAVDDPQSQYQCIFRDNVTVEYESNEVIFADEISINKLLWSSAEDKGSSGNNTKAAVSGSDKSEKTVTPGQSGRAASPAKAIVREKKVIAVIKCTGPMIVKPEHTQADSFSPGEFKKYAELDGDTRKWLGERNVLLSQRIDYDYRREVAKASGKVEMVFYPKSEGSETKLPVVISADRSAEFLVAKKQAQFHGNVVGKMQQENPDYRQANTFYGDRLIVNLTGKQTPDVLMGSGQVSHIELTGSGVRLESVRTSGSKKISHVRLASERIDYFAPRQEIIASGNGRIEYSKAAVKSGSSAKDSKPGYAIVEGFDELVWNMDQKHVMAKSDKKGGIHMGYLPIENDGSYGKKITVDMQRSDIYYIELDGGKAELKKLTAEGGIVYYEQDRYEFVGEDLLYNAAENYMTVRCSQNTPCMLNGVLVDGIEYNLETGQAQAVLGQGVGIISVEE